MTVADCLDDDTSSVTRLSRLPSLSEPYSSLDQFTLLSESQDGVADHVTEAKGKNMRGRKRMICAFIVVLAATVLLGRSWAMFLVSPWICIACIYVSVFRRTNKARKGGTFNPKDG
ncbi:hypothetical protein MLD38_003071 [Melastoma candidum]|uniref:Uncharacterized protein n=1 Tax=Melastoma candidum TaxID=119954 RepID=A0ACB9S576_9MYRT|nr:hypothetical protein MLD38_003071 [Melastoma candidum]